MNLTTLSDSDLAREIARRRFAAGGYSRNTGRLGERRVAERAHDALDEALAEQARRDPRETVICSDTPERLRAAARKD